jgi:CRP/FNR family nitrogen fixation transcriptional regulator
MVEVASGTGLICLRKGQTLYREQDPATHRYEVCSGMIRTCRFGHDGHRQITSFFAPPDLFGIERGHYRTAAEAVTDAVVRSYRKSGGVEYPATPEVSAFLFQALCRADDCIDLLGRRSAVARLAAFLKRQGERSGRRGEVPLPMSREDIADHLALSGETISRTFSELCKRGVISFGNPHFVTIMDQTQLACLAGDLLHPPDMEQDRQRVA